MAPTFTITAQPGTDIWRKPPSTDVFNAPTAAETDSVTKKPLGKFISASLSFSIQPEEQYDQAGLLLSLHPTDSSSSTANTTSPPKWIKTGIEQYQGVPRLGTVGTDSWSDWSIAPVSSSGASSGETWTTILVERSKDDLGHSLWVYEVVGEGEKRPLREINWVFGHGEHWELRVAAYAAKPGSGPPLTVKFKDLKVDWSE